MSNYCILLCRFNSRTTTVLHSSTCYQNLLKKSAAPDFRCFTLKVHPAALHKTSCKDRMRPGLWLALLALGTCLLLGTETIGVLCSHIHTEQVDPTPTQAAHLQQQQQQQDRRDAEQRILQQTAETRAVIRASDFEYLGGFAMPTSACGWSTSWSTAGLALRREGGGVRLLTGAHVYSGLVYEVELPSRLSKSPSDWPVAPLSQDSDALCDIYGGRRRPDLSSGSLEADFNAETHGLHYHADLDRLYWSYGENYNGDSSNDCFIGYTKLQGLGSGGGILTTRGPWRVVGSGLHSQKVRGGSLDIPAWFASQHLAGRSLGIGFGGYYNIIGVGSMGPVLVAVDHPGEAVQSGRLGRPLMLLGHAAVAQFFNRYGWRPATNYWIAENLSWSKSPVGNRGYWAAGDRIEGAGVWIDTGSRHALMFFTSMSTGRVAYENGGVQSEGRQDYWYIYNPMDLVKVANGTAKHWSVRPRQMVAMNYTSEVEVDAAGWTRVTGAVFDNVTSTLYLLQVHATKHHDYDVETYPVVHAYKLKAV